MKMQTLRSWMNRDEFWSKHPILFGASVILAFFVGCFLFAGFLGMIDGIGRPSLSQREQLMNADGFKWNHGPHEVQVIREAPMSEDITHFLVRDVCDECEYSFWIMGPSKFSGHKVVLIIDGARAAPGGTVTDGIVVGIPPSQ